MAEEQNTAQGATGASGVSGVTTGTTGTTGASGAGAGLTGSAQEKQTPEESNKAYVELTRKVDKYYADHNLKDFFRMPQLNFRRIFKADTYEVYVYFPDKFPHDTKQEFLDFLKKQKEVEHITVDSHPRPSYTVAYIDGANY